MGLKQVYIPRMQHVCAAVGLPLPVPNAKAEHERIKKEASQKSQIERAIEK